MVSTYAPDTRSGNNSNAPRYFVTFLKMLTRWEIKTAIKQINAVKNFNAVPQKSAMLQQKPPLIVKLV